MILRFRMLSINSAFLIGVIIVFFVLISPLFFLALGLSYGEIVYPLCVLMSIVAFWIVFTLKNISPDLFNFYSLFLLAAVSFNAGQVLLEVFHLNPMGILDGKFTEETIASTIYLVIIALVSFHLGGLISLRKRDRYEFVANKPVYSSSVTSQSLCIVGYIMLSISVLPVFMEMLDALKIVLGKGYFALYQRGAAAGLASGVSGVKKFLYDFFVPGLLFLLAGSRDRKILKYVLLSALVLHILMLMFMGYRGYATMELIAGLWIWHRLVRPFRIYKILVSGSVLLFVVFPTIRLIRNVAGSTRMNFEFIVNAFLSIENPAIAIIKEMGASMGTIAYTLQLIPQERSFAFGSTYAWAATTVFPNLFWDLHPAFKYGNLGHWLTMTVDPYTFYKGGGLGYSFIAEAYANFGWVGTPFIMGLFGFIIARLTNWAIDREDSGRVAVVSGCIATMLFWPRADVTIFARPLDYYVLPAYIMFLYFRRKIHRRKYLRNENNVCA